MLTDDQLRDFAACLARRVGDALECETVEIPRSKLLVIEAPESITRTNHGSHEKAVDALLTRVSRRVEEGWATVPAPLRLRNEAGAECALWLPLDGVLRVDRDEPSFTAGDDLDALRAYNAALTALRSEGYAPALTPSPPARASRGPSQRAAEKLSDVLAVEARAMRSGGAVGETLSAKCRTFATAHEFHGSDAPANLSAYFDGARHGVSGHFYEGRLVQLARYDRGRTAAVRSIAADGSIAYTDDGLDGAHRKQGLWMHWNAPQRETVWQRFEDGVALREVIVPGEMRLPHPMPERVEAGVVRTRESLTSELLEEHFREGILEARKVFSPDGRTLLREEKGEATGPQRAPR